MKIDKIINRKNKIDGLKLMSMIDDNTIKTAFFDPQYRGILDKLSFGSYNARIPNPRTKNDWLSANELNVDMYQMDNWCGFIKRHRTFCSPTNVRYNHYFFYKRNQQSSCS